MCNRGLVFGVGQGADRIQPLLISNGDPIVLANMLRPGRHDELLDDPVRVGCVLPHSPAARTGAAPTEPGSLECDEQIVGEPLARPVLDTHHDRPTRRFVGCQEGWGQSPAGTSSSGGSAGSGNAARRADRGQCHAGHQHCRRQPQVLGRDAHHGTPTAFPPWNTIR